MPAVAEFAGRYDLLDELGTGSNGTVRRALDRHLNREVAIKLYEHGAQLGVATREAQILVALEGPHILRVFNADKYQDVPYIATEIAAMGSAADHLTARGIRPELAVRWVRHALVGLNVCHARGLIHGDIKPGNIFLQNDELAQLGDFGTAEVMDTTGHTPSRGTWAIRAPECFSAGRMTIASDIYSAGLALYTLLSGSNPFDLGTHPELRDAIVNGRRPPLRDLAPHVPRSLVNRVDRAMEVKPTQRYASAAAFHWDLGRFSYKGRLFGPTAPHPGHDRCWFGAMPNGKAGVQVCVIASDGGHDVEVRRTGGASTRIRERCAQGLSAKQLLVHLRRTFDTL